MKKNMIWVALCFTGLFSSQAQTFTWGTPENSRREIESDVFHQSQDGRLYRIVSHYNDNLFNRDVTIDSYVGDSFKPEEKYDVSVEQPPMGKAMLTHLAIFPSDGVKWISFLDEYDNKTKERALYSQIVNVQTGQKFEQTKVTGMPGRNGDYIIAQSEGKQYFAVIKRFTEDKKQNEKINVVLLDKTGKVVSEISYQTPYLNKAKSDEYVISVSDDGKVYVVRNIDLAKQKPFRALFYWDGKATSMTETSLKLDNDHQIYYTKGWFNGGNFYLQGFATRVGSKGVQVYRGTNPASAVYAAKFDADGKNVYTQINEFPETGLRVREIFHENGKTYLTADKFIEAKKTKPVPGNSFELVSNFSYNNLGYFFTKIDDATGKMEWFKDIPDSENQSENDNGRFLPGTFILRKGEISLFYNDRQKFEIVDAEGKNRSTLDRFVIMETYDTDGKLKSQQTLKKTGLEPRYDVRNGWLEDFDLDTSVLVKVNDNKYIIRSSSGSREKYGYLNF